MTLNVFALGASRNIGYFSCLKFLNEGATVTFLLRDPKVFEEDKTITAAVASGKAHIVKGDALKQEEVAEGWKEALQVGGGSVDLVLFSIGTKPNLKLVLTHGFSLPIADITTRSLLNVLRSMPSFPSESSPAPKFIIISSNGLHPSSHAALPLALKPLYGKLLASAHADKLGLERVAFHAAGLPWPYKAVDAHILPEGWDQDETLPAPGTVKIVILRPALYTDGAEKGKYRLSEGDLKGAWSISRKDVAHFIVTGLWPKWGEWENKGVSMAY